MNLIDAHCHLANLNQLLPVEPLLEEAVQHGISCFLSSALSKSEVDFHLDHPHPEVLFSDGIHPNYDECDLALADLAILCEEKRIWALGEIGLDRYNSDLLWQIRTFSAQLDLAAEHGLPVVLHIVGHQQQAYELLKHYQLKFLVHGYASSVEGFHLLSRLDSVFTISERLLRNDKMVLLSQMLDQGRVLFETDITRYYVQEGEANPLLRLRQVFDRTQQLSGLDKWRLWKLQNSSWQHLMAP